MAAGNNWPLRGHKAELWEGGVRNTAIIHAPGIIGPSHKMYGGEYWGLVHMTDWRPSLQGLAGDAKAMEKAAFPFDGMDLWAAVLSNATSPRTEIVINIDPLDMAPVLSGGGPPSQGAAIRSGKWKLLLSVGNDSWYPVPTGPDTTPSSTCFPGGGGCEWDDRAAVEAHFGLAAGSSSTSARRALDEGPPGGVRVNGLFGAHHKQPAVACCG